MNVAINQMEGRLSKLIGRLRQDILETLAHVEVNIDYPEYDDVEEMTHNILIEKATHVRAEIAKILETSKQGKIYVKVLLLQSSVDLMLGNHRY